MNTTNYIRIFRGDDSDALGYQTIVGTIKTDLDLTGCKAAFRFLGFYAEFNPIPEDKKLTIVIPAQASRGFPPGVGYASLKVFDSLGKIRTFTNRIPVIVDTMTPNCGCGEFEVSFSPFPELEPLKIFTGPNADDFDQYTGFVSKIIDRASLVKYGLAILADAMSEDGGASGKAASPLAVKAAYDAIITELTNNYYTAAETDEAINSVAAYYITRNAAGDAFETKSQLDSATVFYSGGNVRVPTRNDYCVVLADETHDNAEYRYIYAVAEGQTTGSWEAQFPVGGTMTIDSSVTKNSSNPVTSSGIWYAIWGTASTAFTSLYDWVVSQLAGKEPLFQASTASGATIKTVAAIVKDGSLLKPIDIPTSGMTVNGKALSSDVTLTGADIAVSGTDATKIDAALTGKANDDAVVKLTGDQSIAGTKTFTSGVMVADVAGFGVVDPSTSAMAQYKQSGIEIYPPDSPSYVLQHPAAAGVIALTAGTGHNGNLAALDSQGNPTDSLIPASNVALKGNIPYDRITITTGQLQDHAEQKVTLNAATTTLSLPALTDLTGKVSDFGIDVVNGYEVSGTPTAASFQLDGTLGTDYNLIIPDGETWSGMTALAAGEMAIYYFTLSAFQIGDLPTWGVTKQVVTPVPVPVAP